MAIRQIGKRFYKADEDTTRKELKEAGWISSVKLSRMEGMWAVALLKRDIIGLMKAGLEILSFHSGWSKKYYYREEQIVPALRALQEYLCNRDINHACEAQMKRIRDFWRQYNGDIQR